MLGLVRAFVATVSLGVVVVVGNYVYWEEGVKVKGREYVRDYVCSLEGKVGKNKGELGKFLRENGGVGLQILGYRGWFRCAGDIGDGELDGLLEYLNVVLPILKKNRNGVWAVRREYGSPDGWNILENNNYEDITVLKPIVGL